MRCCCVGSTQLCPATVVDGWTDVLYFAAFTDVLLVLFEEDKKPVILTNKEAHTKQKSLRADRRQKDRSHYDVTVEMKKIWEDLRRHDLPKDKRAELSQKVSPCNCLMSSFV